MDLKSILSIVQIVLTLVITFLVLSQSQGSGLSLIFGGSSNYYRSKRGVEKVFFISTIVAGILFLTNSLVIYFVL